MASSKGVTGTQLVSSPSVSRLFLSQLQSEEVSVLLIGTHAQTMDIFYEGIQVFERDRNFQNVVFAHLIADYWAAHYQVPEGSVVVLCPPGQAVERYDLFPGFSVRSLQSFIRQHAHAHACLTTPV